MAPTPANRQVLALVVADTESPHLERTLVSLFTQTRPPERIVIGIREGDPSRVEALMARVKAPASASVRRLDAPATFFAGIEEMNAGTEAWLWLLHDDSAPEAHALERLLDAAERDEDVALVGAKQVGWDNPRELLELGIRATRTARRIPETAEGELDQGQHDRRFEVLGVGSAGMLARREAVRAAGGFDAGFGPFGDGLELSRRMRAAGHKVAVAPLAKVRHARASFGQDPRASFAARRLAQIRLCLISCPALLLPVAVLGYLLLAVLRALGRIVAKEPRLALAELVAALGMLRQPGAVRRSRRLLDLASTGEADVRSFEDSARTVRMARREVRADAREAAGMAETRDPVAVRGEQARQLLIRSNGRIVAAIVLAVGILAQLPRLASGTLEGGALLPDSSAAGTILSLASSPWLASGDGVAAPIDALWVLASPLAGLFGSLGAAASWLVLLAVPLAGIIAYACSGAVASSPHARAAGAMLWAFAPPLLDAVSAGQVAGVAVHLAIPALMAALGAAWRGSAAALAAASLLLAVAAAASPGLLAGAVVLAAVGFSRAPEGRLRWLLLPLPALVLLLPTLIAAGQLEESWRLLFATPGRAVPVSPSALSLLSFCALGQVTLAELAAFGCDALLRIVPALILLALAALALVRLWRHRAIRFGWLVLALGWGWAMAASVVMVDATASPAGSTLVSGWAGIGLSVAFAGLCLVLVAGAERQRVGTATLATKKGATILTALGVAAPAVFGGYWAADSLWGDASMLEGAARHVPAIAQADAQSPARSRVLALRPTDGGLEAEIWRGDGIELHESSMVLSLAELEATGGKGPLPASRADLVEALAALPVGSAQLREALAAHAISLVLVPAEVERGEAEALAVELNSQQGLEFAAENEVGSFWRAASAGAPCARLSLTDGESTVALDAGAIGAKAKIPAGDGPRTLHLAERASDLWHALYTSSAGTVSLEPAGEGWRQEWTVPQEAGTVSIGAGSPVLRALPWLAVAVLAIAAVAALPFRRTGGDW